MVSSDQIFSFNWFLFVVSPLLCLSQLIYLYDLFFSLFLRFCVGILFRTFLDFLSLLSSFISCLQTCVGILFCNIFLIPFSLPVLNFFFLNPSKTLRGHIVPHGLGLLLLLHSYYLCISKLLFLRFLISRFLPSFSFI